LRYSYQCCLHPHWFHGITPAIHELNLARCSRGCACPPPRRPAHPGHVRVLRSSLEPYSPGLRRAPPSGGPSRAWTACLPTCCDRLPSGRARVISPLPSASIGAPSLALSAHIVPLPSPPPPADWVVDSGASFHTTPTISSLSHSHLPHPSHPHSIVVGNGSTLPVTLIGASVLLGPFHLNDTLVAPGLTHPLLSVRHFTSDNHCSMEFDPWGLTIRHLPSRVVIARYDSSGPLYSLHLPSTSLTSVASPHALATTTTSAVWHRRLGHPGPNVMSQLSSHSDISYSRGSSERLCHACQFGCHSHIPFSTSTSRAAQPFDLLHCDLWTSPILSLSGYKYYLVILDDFSHFLWTSPFG
jgi:hypothetical protein